MAQVLKCIPGCQCYLDNMLVIEATNEEHPENFQKILVMTSEYGLGANKLKSEFFQLSIVALSRIKQFCISYKTRLKLS